MSSSRRRSSFPGGDSLPLPRHPIPSFSPSSSEDPWIFTDALRERAKALVLKSKNPKACLHRFREKLHSHLDLWRNPFHPLEERVILESNKKGAIVNSEAASSCSVGLAPTLMEQHSTVEEETVVTGATTHGFAVKEPGFTEFIDSCTQLFSANLQIGVHVQQGSVVLPLEFCNDLPDPGKGRIKEDIYVCTAHVCARSVASIGNKGYQGRSSLRQVSAVQSVLIMEKKVITFTDPVRQRKETPISFDPGILIVRPVFLHRIECNTYMGLDDHRCDVVTRATAEDQDQEETGSTCSDDNLNQLGEATVIGRPAAHGPNAPQAP